MYFLIAFLPVALGLSCSNEMKQGPYQLTVPDQKLPNITKTILLVQKYNVSKESVDLIMGYRALWTSYCYNGGALDPNTGCYDSLTPKPPTSKELLEWSKRDECEVCNDATDAWGSDAEVCLSQTLPCNNWVPRKELRRTSTNNHFAYHTCEMSWRCGISSSTIPLKMRIEKKPELYIALPNGTMVTNLGGYFHLDGQTSFILDHVPEIQSTVLHIKCTEEGDRKFWCVDPDSLHAFIIGLGGTTCQYGTCYRFNGEANVPEKMLARRFRVNSKTVDTKATLEDLKADFDMEMVELEDLKYTVLKIAHRTIVLEKTLVNIINSVAKIDDKLLQTVLKGSFSTEFLNNELFFIKPCLQDPQIKSNCIGEKIFKDGRWTQNKNKANCINLKTYKMINLFDILDIWLPEVSEVDKQGAPDDYTGWSWYANSRDSIEETMEYTHNGGRGTSLNDVLSMPKGVLSGTLGSIWGFSVVNFISLIVVVFALCFFVKKF